jgi:hypothetical protein
MSIHSINSTSIWITPLTRPDFVATSDAIRATSAVDPVPSLQQRSSVAAVGSGAVFHNLLSELMRQKLLSPNATGDDDAQAADGLQRFLQTLIQSLTPERSGPPSGSTVQQGTVNGAANRFTSNSLETGIRSLLDALGSASNGSRVDQLVETFRSLLGAGTFSRTAAASGNGATLTLQSVLQGMMQNVQHNPAGYERGQLVDVTA